MHASRTAAPSESGRFLTSTAWSPTGLTAVAGTPGGTLLILNSEGQQSSEQPPKKHGPCTTANGAPGGLLICTVGVHPPAPHGCSAVANTLFWGMLPGSPVASPRWKRAPSKQQSVHAKQPSAFEHRPTRSMVMTVPTSCNGFCGFTALISSRSEWFGAQQQPVEG